MLAAYIGVLCVASNVSKNNINVNTVLYWLCITIRQLTQASGWVGKYLYQLDHALSILCHTFMLFQQQIFWGQYLHCRKTWWELHFHQLSSSSPHHAAACISNTQGTVTKCVLPEAGVYELDDRVRLYLTHCECLDLCRGVRCGAVIELHNMHVMKLSGTPWKVKFNAVLSQASAHTWASAHPPILSVLWFFEILRVTAHHAKFLRSESEGRSAELT